MDWNAEFDETCVSDDQLFRGGSIIVTGSLASARGQFHSQSCSWESLSLPTLSYPELGMNMLLPAGGNNSLLSACATPEQQSYVSRKFGTHLTSLDEHPSFCEGHEMSESCSPIAMLGSEPPHGEPSSAHEYDVLKEEEEEEEEVVVVVVGTEDLHEDEADDFGFTGASLSRSGSHNSGQGAAETRGGNSSPFGICLHEDEAAIAAAIAAASQRLHSESTILVPQLQKSFMQSLMPPPQTEAGASFSRSESHNSSQGTAGNSSPFGTCLLSPSLRSSPQIKFFDSRRGSICSFTSSFRSSCSVTGMISPPAAVARASMRPQSPCVKKNMRKSRSQRALGVHQPDDDGKLLMSSIKAMSMAAGSGNNNPFLSLSRRRQPMPAPRMSVRSSFQGRRGSMVALDVMHGEDEISRATVQVMKSRQATVTTNSPEQTFRQPSGRGMIPSSSCSQLGRLGFEAAEHMFSPDFYRSPSGPLASPLPRTCEGNATPSPLGSNSSRSSKCGSVSPMSQTSPSIHSTAASSPRWLSRNINLNSSRSHSGGNCSPIPGVPFTSRNSRGEFVAKSNGASTGTSRSNCASTGKSRRSPMSSRRPQLATISPQARQLQWKSMSQFQSGMICPEKAPSPSHKGKASDTQEPSTMFFFAPRKAAKIALRLWPEKDEEEFERGKRMLETLDLDPTEFKADTLVHLVLEIFVSLNLPELLKTPVERLQKFILAVMGRMRNNPYHNWFHVFDVTQTVYVLAINSGLMEQMSPMEKFALITAALCHDLEHPGFNNLKLLEKDEVLDPRVKSYASLEKHHSLRAFEVMVDTDIDLLSGFNTSAYYTFRAMVVNVILSTDMTKHKEYLERAQSIQDDGDLMGAIVQSGKDLGSPGNISHRSSLVIFAMQLLIKAADISNPFKPFPVAAMWAVRVTDEFFEQGRQEAEAGLDVTPTCDRTKQTRVGLQKGFIDFLAKPYFSCVGNMFPKLKTHFERVLENRAKWDSLTDERLEEDYGYTAARDGRVASVSSSTQSEEAGDDGDMFMFQAGEFRVPGTLQEGEDEGQE